MELFAESPDGAGAESLLGRNDEFARSLESSGALAQRQRLAALVAGVRASAGVVRALVRAAKQAQASEAQRLGARRRKLEADALALHAAGDIGAAADAAAAAEELAVKALRVRGIPPSAVAGAMLAQHAVEPDEEARLELGESAAFPGLAERASPRKRRRSDEPADDESSEELALLCGNKLMLEAGRRLLRWLKAAAYTNRRIAAADLAGPAAAEAGEAGEAGEASGTPPDSGEDGAAAGGAADAPQPPSRRKQKREAKERERLAAHVRGRGAGRARGLDERSGEPRFEDKHASWRAAMTRRAFETKAVERALAKAALK